MNDERLAAYVSGDLDPDERAEIAALLAGDAALRARADRIAAADRALRDLPDVPLPEGFSDRLQATLQPELDEILGDELAARRARRAISARWLTAGAAAAVVAVVAVGAVMTGFGGGDGDLTATNEDAAGLAESLVAPGADGPLPAPQIVALGRELTDEDLRDLASRDDFTVAMDTQLHSDEAEEQAGRAQDQFSAYTAEAPQVSSQGGTGGDTAPAESDGVDLSAVSACLPTVIESSDQPLIPLYAELATYRGEDVVVFALLAPRGDSGDMTRIEVWVLSVDGCQTRYFTQHDG